MNGNRQWNDLCRRNSRRQEDNMRRNWIKRMTAAALSLVMAISAPLAGMASTGPAATTQEGKDREALALEMER